MPRELVEIGEHGARRGLDDRALRILAREARIAASESQSVTARNSVPSALSRRRR